MNPFRIYLRSELGKLKSHGDAICFLESVQSAVLMSCGFGDSPSELVSKFSAQAEVDSFVQSLGDDQVQALTKSCDEDWRKNGVFSELLHHSPWAVATALVGFVEVNQAEPHLAHIFKRNGFSLTAIAADADLWTQKPYACWNLDAGVQFPMCLGRLRAGRFKLFDGIHRAILKCRQGTPSLEICFYEG